MTRHRVQSEGVVTAPRRVLPPSFPETAPTPSVNHTFLALKKLFSAQPRCGVISLQAASRASEEMTSSEAIRETWHVDGAEGYITASVHPSLQKSQNFLRRSLREEVSLRLNGRRWPERCLAGIKLPSGIYCNNTCTQ